jgi:UDP-N-acetylmuramate--alanine ligase
LCPIYKAGENLKLKFDYFKFAKEIIKNSKVELIMINSEKELAKYAKHNIYGNNIIIGMGAGTISNWMRNLPKLIK